MFKINRKMIVIASMVLLLLVTGYINFKLAAAPADKTDTGGDVTTGNFFTDFRVKREQTREQELAYIDSVIANANTDQQTLSEAQMMKLDMTGIMETELKVEGLLKAKGFSDAVVTVGDDSVNVVIKKETLSQNEVAQILEVVKTETKMVTKNIKIIPSK